MNKITQRVKTYPVFTGIILGLIFFICVMSSLRWFPWLVDAWINNNANVRSIYLTIVIFAVFIPCLWRQRFRNPTVFWATICILFLCHVSFIVYFSSKFHPPSLREWLVLLAVESFILVFVTDWTTRRWRTRPGPQKGGWRG